MPTRPDCLFLRRVQVRYDVNERIGDVVPGPLIAIAWTPVIADSIFTRPRLRECPVKNISAMLTYPVIRLKFVNMDRES
jgi:hypothetical protein